MKQLKHFIKTDLHSKNVKYVTSGKLNGQKIQRTTNDLELAKDYEKQFEDGETYLILSNKKLKV